jgi:hypothetical protein
MCRIAVVLALASLVLALHACTSATTGGRESGGMVDSSAKQGTAEAVVYPYSEVRFDHTEHMEAVECESCHHEGASTTKCAVCHDRHDVVAGVRILQDIMHSPDGGCRQCHDDRNPDDTWDCSFCHRELDHL